MAESADAPPIPPDGELLPWPDAKRWYFGEDGTLRDIVVPDSTELEWVRLIDWVVENGVPHCYGQHGVNAGQSLINATLFDENRLAGFSLYPDSICLCGHPIDPSWFELDVAPDSIRSEGAYLELLDVLRTIAAVIGRTLEIRPEGQGEKPIFLVHADGSTAHVRVYHAEPGATSDFSR